MLEFYLSHQVLFAVFAIAALGLSLIMFVVVMVMFVRVAKTRRFIDSLSKGKDGVNLEATIIEHSKKLQSFDEEIQELFNISNKINSHSHKCLYKIGLVKFNPFGERSGNQSFAVALLNGKNDGLVVSSLHTREGTRVYAKQIKQNQPVNNQLTAEEQEAVSIAR